jgi:uncharacterized membrane protein
MADAQALPAPPPSLEDVKNRRKPLKGPVKIKDNLSPLDKLAVFITERVGTMGFFLIIFGWTFVWLAWNFLLPKSLRFDPPMGFVFYLFISNVIQILLMPLIMVGQNIQGRAADRRAESDLEVNVKAEKEIEVILQHLEYQNQILLSIVKKVDTTLAEAMQRREQQHAELLAAINRGAPKTAAAAAKAPARKAPAKPRAK